MEITVKVDDKLVQEVKDARASLAKIKAAIDKARKAAAKWFDPNGLKLSEESEKKIGDAHLVYDQKIAEITNAVAESILGQKIDVDAENPETENGQQVKSDSANADAEPKTLRELSKQQATKQVKNEDAQNDNEPADEQFTDQAKAGNDVTVTINDVHIVALDVAEQYTSPYSFNPKANKDFDDLPAGLKRVVCYLSKTCLTQDNNPSTVHHLCAFMRAMRSIDELPATDWKLLYRAFIVAAENALVPDWRALLYKLADTAKLDNTRDVFKSVCARMYAVIKEPAKSTYIRLCEAIEEAKKWNLPEELNDDEGPKETAAEHTEEEKKEPAADAKIPAPVEELPKFLKLVKLASNKEEINRLVGEARIATTGSEAKGLVFYGDPFITNKDYALLQQALADREQELKKKEVKDFRFLRRAGDFHSSFAVRIAYDLCRRIKGDKDVKLDHLRDITGLLSDDKEKAQLLAEINTYARNIGEL